MATIDMTVAGEMMEIMQSSNQVLKNTESHGNSTKQKTTGTLESNTSKEIIL